MISIIDYTRICENFKCKYDIIRVNLLMKGMLKLQGLAVDLTPEREAKVKAFQEKYQLDNGRPMSKTQAVTMMCQAVFKNQNINPNVGVTKLALKTLVKDQEHLIDYLEKQNMSNAQQIERIINESVIVDE